MTNSTNRPAMMPTIHNTTLSPVLIAAPELLLARIRLDAELGLTLPARQIFSRACVHSNQFSFIDEQRYAYDGPGLELCGLAASRRSIATHARIGLDDLEFDVRRRRHLQRLAIP